TAAACAPAARNWPSSRGDTMRRGTAVAEGPAASGPWHLPLPDASRSAGVMSEPMTAEEIVRYVVSRAVWAPSVHNTQPWRFAADGGPRISLHADVERRLAVADPDGREMMISCGAALFTIRLALRSLGYIPETRVLPDPAQPDLAAQVSWRERAAADESERRLWSHVLTRRTHRGAFDPEPLPPDTLAGLRDAAAR